MKYSDRLVEKVREWVSTHGLMQRRFGCTLSQFLDEFGIDDKTYYGWLKAHPEFARAIEEGQEAYEVATTLEVENALRRKAIGGFSITDEVTVLESSPEGEPLIVQQKITKKEQAPDTAAAIFVITNLKASEWKNKQTTALEGEGLPNLVVEVIGKDGKLGTI